MAAKLAPRQRVRVKTGPHAGRTAKTVRLHGGKGFARFWLVWWEGTAWDSPLFGQPENNLESIA
jgi:hypothetical protein